MAKMRTIEIDPEARHAIGHERTGLDGSPDNVLRRSLNLPTSPPPQPDTTPPGNKRSWTYRGVELPHGTKLRMACKGRTHHGEIHNGEWVIRSERCNKPSLAATFAAETKNEKQLPMSGWTNLNTPGSINRYTISPPLPSKLDQDSPWPSQRTMTA